VQAAGQADDSPADQDRAGLQGGCTLYTVAARSMIGREGFGMR
jgi:hypothetical protein